jgi:hypothetical protein
MRVPTQKRPHQGPNLGPGDFVEEEEESREVQRGAVCGSREEKEGQFYSFHTQNRSVMIPTNYATRLRSMLSPC